MSEVEKQEGQKTVVAFIAGLLIGGLLVWVFSSSEPAEAPAETEQDDAPAEVASEGTEPATEDAPAGETATPNTTTEPVAELPVGDGKLDVANQTSGYVVALAGASYPTTDGWVAVRDYNNGIAGGILGAARYSQSQGLIPQEVELLRATEAGKTYVAVFYTEDGSVDEAGKLYFDPAGDQQIDGIATPFTVE